MISYDSLIFITLLATIIVNSVFASAVYARTYRKWYGLYFLLTIGGIILWSIGDLLLLFSDSRPIVNFGARLFYVAPMIIPIFIWFFGLSFPSNQKVMKPAWLLASSMFVMLSAALLFDFNFFIKYIDTHEGLNIPVPSLPGFLVYAAYFSLFFGLAYLAFFTKLKQVRGQSKMQISYTLYGALVASVPALITNLSLPILGTRETIWLGPSFTLFFAGAVTLAIVRHRLFDIRPVIVRTLGYMLTIMLVASAYGFVIFGFILFITDVRIAFPVQVALAVSTGVATLLFHNLKGLIDKFTKKLFYQDSYSPQEFFDEYNKALVSTIDLDLLLRRVSAVIVKHLKAQSCHIGVKDGSIREYQIVGTDNKKFSDTEINQIRGITPHIHYPVIIADDLGPDQQQLRQVLDANDIAVLVRLTTDFRTVQEGIGYLVLGPKKSGNLYSPQDVQVIESIANELIIALQNALRFEEIERFNETLQQRVQDATRQLRESNKKLKQLNESKDDFIGMASHQLRTPLTSIKGYISLVMDGDAGRVNADQKRLLQQAFFSSQKMVFLVADLLNVSRLKTGKFVIERKSINLDKVIRDEMTQLKLEAANRGLKLTYEAPKHFPILPLDETKTRQVLMNFMDNAIYYTPSGGHVRAELKDLPKSVEFRVIDDGIGVPKAERYHLFTKFYRAKNAQRARPDGTGLGLYMAQKIITAQGGAIIFNSEEGKGSTFGFVFPKDLPSESVTLPVQLHD